MIAACPKCQTRYRLRLEQLGERGVRLRCRRCESLFRVLPPPEASAADAAPAPERAAQAPPEPTPSRAPEPRTRAPEPRAATPRPAISDPADPAGGAVSPGDAPAVLVAHRDARAAKRLADLVGAGAQRAAACHDGVQALLALHRTPPRAALLDAGLPGIDGHQICEVVKRNEALSRISIVLLRDADADAADPAAAGFGADLYLDAAECADALPAPLREALAAAGVVLPALEPAAAAAPPSAPAAEPSPPAPVAAPPEAPSASAPIGEPPAPGPAASPAAAPADDEELARAERLARIAVSDIVLYNEEKFAAALRSGDPLEAMRDEVEEGRSLLRGRIEPAVFEQRDFVGEELLRVARERA